MKRSIGIYAGTFNPIHVGHLAFALQAAKTAGLTKTVFLPERRPRYKPRVEHFGHRTAMISRAIRPYNQLMLLELPDLYFSVSRTWPKLKKEFNGCSLKLIIGSDVAASLKDWPDINQLLSDTELIVGLRQGDTPAAVRQVLEQLSPCPRYRLIPSQAPGISSHLVRRALAQGTDVPGLLDSVRGYARHQWLYAQINQLS